MARAAAALALLVCLVAGAAAKPNAVPTSPTAAPTTPTGAPTTPTTAPSPTSPTAAPTTPTKAPSTPTAAPTPSPPVCTSGNYLNTTANTCNKCVSSKSPFNVVRGRKACVLPETLSSKSTVCTAAVLPAFIRSNVDKKTTVGCINPLKQLVTLFLPITSSKYPFLNAGAYTKASIRLNNSILVSTTKNGYAAETVTVNGIKRLQIQLVDKFNTLRKVRHGTVHLTGVIRRDGDLLDYCFISYLKVC